MTAIVRNGMGTVQNAAVLIVGLNAAGTFRIVQFVIRYAPIRQRSRSESPDWINPDRNKISAGLYERQRAVPVRCSSAVTFLASRRLDENPRSGWTEYE